MIKQGKNTIYCNECNAEIEMKLGLIETKYLNKGIQIQFYRCNKCGVKYIVDVTDYETRFKQMELHNMQEKQKFLMDTIDNNNLEERTTQTILNNEAMEVLLKEIKEAKAELKKKYEGEL